MSIRINIEANSLNTIPKLLNLGQDFIDELVKLYVNYDEREIGDCVMVMQDCINDMRKMRKKYGSIYTYTQIRTRLTTTVKNCIETLQKVNEVNARP